MKILLSRLRTPALALAIAATLSGAVSGVASAAADALIVQAQTANAYAQSRLSGAAGNVAGKPSTGASDLSVEFVDVSERGRSKTYVYRVRNTGGATARGVKVEKICAYQQGPYAGDVHSNTGWQQLGDMASGMTVEVQVPCFAPPQELVVASSAEAYTSSTEAGAHSNTDSVGIARE